MSELNFYLKEMYIMNENILVEESTNTVVSCPKCKKDMLKGSTICPNCGKTINTNKKKIKFKFIIIISIVLIVLFALVGFVVYKKVSYDRYLKEYSANFELINYLMLSNASESEKCMNLISKVWYNTIYEKSDNETDKYTKYSVDYSTIGLGIDYYFYDDFNKSIEKLYLNKEFSDKISNIRDSKELISDMMKKIQNPPESYGSAYDTLLELFSVYQEIISLTVNPNGSLTAFNSNKNQKIEKFSSLYEKIKIQIPSKK
jgi:hypothetical protein